MFIHGRALRHNLDKPYQHREAATCGVGSTPSKCQETLHAIGHVTSLFNGVEQDTDPVKQDDDTNVELSDDVSAVQILAFRTFSFFPPPHRLTHAELSTRAQSWLNPL